MMDLIDKSQQAGDRTSVQFPAFVLCAVWALCSGLVCRPQEYRKTIAIHDNFTRQRFTAMVDKCCAECRLINLWDCGIIMQYIELKNITEIL